MYGEDPSDSALGPRREDEPRDARAKNDEEDAYETNRPKLRYEDFSEE